VEATFTSLAYGDAQTTASGTDLDPYHYATLDHDAESGSLLSGTDHAQFRQYSDTQGNWFEFPIRTPEATTFPIRRALTGMRMLKTCQSVLPIQPDSSYLLASYLWNQIVR